MCSRFLSILLLSATVSAQTHTLRVCADPQNLPFSSVQQNGFDNQIARLLGRELHAQVSFEWQRLGRGFIRNVVNKGACDVLLGVPVGMHGLLVTQPYYRSTYVFVTRASEPPISSLDDPRLMTKTIGIQVLEEDYAPPARALGRRGMANNVRGVDMDDPGAIIAAVADRKVDMAIVWGPLAGYYAARYGNHVRLTQVEPEIDPPKLPFTYAIGAGVGKSNPELYNQINAAIGRAQHSIQQILRAYHVPLLPLQGHEKFSTGE